jgi:hypothetical protein
LILGNKFQDLDVSKRFRQRVWFITISPERKSNQNFLPQGSYEVKKRTTFSFSKT